MAPVFFDGHLYGPEAVPVPAPAAPRHAVAVVDVTRVVVVVVHAVQVGVEAIHEPGEKERRLLFGGFRFGGI